MDFSYQINGIELQVYAGKLNKEVKVVDEVNKLYWFDSNEDFFDTSRFAGEGNIGHMVEQIKLYKEDIFNAKQEDKMDKIVVEVGSTCTKVDKYDGEKIVHLKTLPIEFKKNFKKENKLNITNNILLLFCKYVSNITKNKKRICKDF